MESIVSRRGDVRAIFLLATLNHKQSGGEFSHTEVLSDLVIECLRDHGIVSRIVRLADHWGNHSSLMQRVIERLDELHNELLETGESRLDNKVGGIVITGEEDGEQHITGCISNFMLNLGATLPPHCGISYQASYTRATKKSLARKFREETTTADAAAKMARNLATVCSNAEGTRHLKSNCVWRILPILPRLEKAY